NVCIKGSRSMYDLHTFNDHQVYRAENGQPGESLNRKGNNGKDLILIVPLVTEVIMDGKVFGRVSEDGQIIKLLDGTKGNHGNVSIGRHFDLRATNALKETKPVNIQLQLKLHSDVIFMGYPNAGKSSMLNSLTNAKVKTAAYEFTTLEPQLGLMDGIRLMDLPGLINGTNEGRGLGTSFVKHTENAKLVAHFVSLENENPLQTYLNLREEIKKISEDLYNKPEVIILTKTDEKDPKEVEAAVNAFKKKGLNVLTSSIIDDASISKIKEVFKEELKKQKEAEIQEEV
ncbi:MAG TPA: GTPase, partial [Candidatus Dojkabacteria bacterium]|nr:GTPase [Candidatus Dojkabacteria bacterium]